MDKTESKRPFRADDICNKVFMRPLDEVVSAGTLVEPNFYPERYRVRRVVRCQEGEYPNGIVAYDLWVSPASDEREEGAREIPLYGYLAVGASVVSVYGDCSNKLKTLTDDGYPTPNENGVYCDKDGKAITTEIRVKKTKITIYALQIGANKFISSDQYDAPNSYCGGPLAADKIFPTLEMAIDRRLENALWRAILASLHDLQKVMIAKKLVVEALKLIGQERRPAILAFLEQRSQAYMEERRPALKKAA